MNCPQQISVRLLANEAARYRARRPLLNQLIQQSLVQRETLRCMPTTAARPFMISHKEGVTGIELPPRLPMPGLA